VTRPDRPQQDPADEVLERGTSSAPRSPRPRATTSTPKECDSADVSHRRDAARNDWDKSSTVDLGHRTFTVRVGRGVRTDSLRRNRCDAAEIATFAVNQLIRLRADVYARTSGPRKASLSAGGDPESGWADAVYPRSVTPDAWTDLSPPGSWMGTTTAPAEPPLAAAWRKSMRPIMSRPEVRGPVISKSC